MLARIPAAVQTSCHLVNMILRLFECQNLLKVIVVPRFVGMSAQIVKYLLTRGFQVGLQPAIFQGGGGLVELVHCDENFVTNTRKKAPDGKMLEFFLLDSFKTTF